MGYTHYLKRPLSLKNFKEAALATKRAAGLCHYWGIDIVGPMGEHNSNAIFNSRKIAFNGSNKQEGPWTIGQEITIPWPTEKDVAPSVEEVLIVPTNRSKVIGGKWFAGDMIKSRIAPNGSGDYEGVFTLKKFDVRDGEHDGNGLYSEFCKTAYRPYDILVMVAYLAVKYYDNRCIVKSDGEITEWQVAFEILSPILREPIENLKKLYTDSSNF